MLFVSRPAPQRIGSGGRSQTGRPAATPCPTRPASAWCARRHHRYIFEAKEDKKAAKAAAAKAKASGAPPPTVVQARLQELGPRFTLKLQRLQKGTFDAKTGEYEWVHNRKKLDTSRRRFHL